MNVSLKPLSVELELIPYPYTSASIFILILYYPKRLALKQP